MPIFHPFVKRRNPDDATPPVGAAHFTGTEYPVIVAPHEAPEPPRRGATPARHAENRSVNFFFNPSQFILQGFLGEFTHPAFSRSHRMLKQPFDAVANYPLAAAKIDQERANIRRPQPVTYGSQFEVG